MTKEQEIASSLLWSEGVHAIQLVAGAGSGKTTTLIETVKRGIEAGFSPEEICLITFTKKASVEMRQRLDAKGTRAGFTGTMHSLGFDIIKSYFKKTCLPVPKIIKDKNSILMESAKDVLSMYSHIPLSVLTDKRMLPKESYNLLMEKYSHYKHRFNLIDLDDLITMATGILENNPGEFKYKYVLVDEFQDTSPDQLSFIQSMKPEKIFAVGDDWQSIYSFRGADVTAAINFNQHFKNSQRLFLTSNFRSQKAIVDIGNLAIKLSSSFIKKKLRAVHKKKSKPVCHIVNFSSDIETIWNSYLKKVSPDKIKNLTVLVRTNYIRARLKEASSEDLKVLTVHSSKGMEFENVLVFGIAKNIFPHRWNNFDEEVRLLYVAITRAKHSLEFLSWEDDNEYSEFMPFLAKNCKISYLKEYVRAQELTG
jgi:DNA helicase-2/ATP-dependent DNA helicase PcrA